MNDPIRIGLIGLGSWAKSAYVPILQEQSNVRVVAVAAKSAATLQAARNIFGPLTSTHDNYHDLLNHTEVDAVMIGLPDSLTAQATVAALKADKHVWVEPPIEVAAEGNGVLELAAKSDKVFHVDLELRYLPVVKSIQDIVSAGDIGRLLSVSVELSIGSASVEGEPEQERDVIGLGTWYIDLLDAFVGREPQRVDGFASHPRYAGLMEWETFNLQYPDGVVGEWLVNPHNAGDWELRMKLVGSDGEVEANLMDGSYRHRTTGNSWLSGSADCARPKSGFVGMRKSVQAFLAAIQGEKNSLSGPEPYKRIYRSLEALRQAKQEERSITLDVARLASWPGSPT